MGDRDLCWSNTAGYRVTLSEGGWYLLRNCLVRPRADNLFANPRANMPANSPVTNRERDPEIIGSTGFFNVKVLQGPPKIANPCLKICRAGGFLFM